MRAVSSEEPTSVVVSMVPTVAGEKACFAEIQAQYHTQQTVSEATQRLGDQEQLSITREKLHDSILSRMVPEFPAIRDGVLAAKTDGFPAVTTAGGIYFPPSEWVSALWEWVAIPTPCLAEPVYRVW